MRKKIPNFGKILDYGANDGHVTSRLFKKHPPSDVYVADLQNKLSIENKKYGWNFLEVNPQTSSINVEDYFFDIVTCMHVLEHVPQPENPLREFLRVMKKKGKLYLETPNQRSLYTPSLTNDRTWNFFIMMLLTFGLLPKVH